MSRPRALPLIDRPTSTVRDGAGTQPVNGEPPRRPDRLLSWPEVHARVGLSRATVWRLERAGMFPSRIRISAGRVAWRESEIDAFVAGLWKPDGRAP